VCASWLTSGAAPGQASAQSRGANGVPALRRQQHRMRQGLATHGIQVESFAERFARFLQIAAGLLHHPQQAEGGG
jgi:hypothetical protein